MEEVEEEQVVRELLKHSPFLLYLVVLLRYR